MLSESMLSPGKIRAFKVIGFSGWTPPSSQNVHKPIKNSLEWNEHDITCSELQNSGLIERILATPVSSRFIFHYLFHWG